MHINIGNINLVRSVFVVQIPGKFPPLAGPQSLQIFGACIA